MVKSHNIVFTFLLIFKLDFSSFRYTHSTVLLSPLFISITFHVVCLGEKRAVTDFARKSVTNLDKILKSKDIILATKVRIVKAMVSPVVRY